MAKDFPGLRLDELREFETCFSINVNVFELKEEDDSAVAIYKSIGLHSETIYFNLHDGHFSYIVKPNAYCKKFKCTQCEKLFKTTTDLRKHSAVCEEITKKIYPGGYFTPGKTIFEELEEMGVDVEETER